MGLLESRRNSRKVEALHFPASLVLLLLISRADRDSGGRPIGPRHYFDVTLVGLGLAGDAAREVRG